MKRPPSVKPITVLLAEDHAIVRQGIRNLLAIEPDMEVVGEAETGREALALSQKLRPSVVVMDFAMPLLNGLEAARQILKTVPGTRVLILSAHNDDAYVEQVMSLGAAGYLLKQNSIRVLCEAIREIHKGKSYLCPFIVQRLRKPPRQSRAPCEKGPTKRSPLSSREMEVLQLIAEGLPNKQVASELAISVKTVEKHRQSLMKKLNIHDLASLTRYAVSAGIIESSVQLTTL